MRCSSQIGRHHPTRGNACCNSIWIVRSQSPEPPDERLLELHLHVRSRAGTELSEDKAARAYCWNNRRQTSIVQASDKRALSHSNETSTKPSLQEAALNPNTPN